MTHGVFKPARVTVRPERVLKVHRYPDPAAVRPEIKAAAETWSARAVELMQAEIYYKRFPVRSCGPDALSIAGGAPVKDTSFSCGAFGRYLAGSSEVVVFILSTGMALDEEVRARIDDFDLLEALFLETSGWLGIEAATAAFARHLRAEVAPEGLAITSRMGPGYSYRINGEQVSWSLEEQKQLFDLFADVNPPVELLESCAMMPKLSRSGLYGLVPVSESAQASVRLKDPADAASER